VFAVDEERRKLPRLKSLLRGRVYFNNRNSTIECLVRDITANGARLAFGDDVAIPDVVELYVPHKDQIFRSHVIWQRGSEAGIAFSVGATEQQPAEGDLAERVRKLEHEVEQLRRILKRLKAETPSSDFEAA
jgi:PilZ domain